MDSRAARNRPSLSKARSDLQMEILKQKLATERAKTRYFEEGALAMQQHGRAMTAAANFFERENQHGNAPNDGDL